MAQEFVPGQVWAYRDAVPETSRVVIGRVDRLKEMTIVSVSVTDAPIPTANGPLQTIGHMPFEEAALRSSLTGLEGNTQVPAAFAEGYATWRAAFDENRAGAFTLSVPDAVGYIKQIIEQPPQ